MIISCDECNTKFMVKAESFGQKPRKVRCGNCSNIWTQEPLDEEAVRTENKVIQDQKENLAAAVQAKAEGIRPSLPIVVVTKQVPKWIKPAVVALVVLNIFSFIILNKEKIGQTGFYNMLGNYDTKNVTVTAQLTGVKNDDKNVYLSWAIHNDNKAAVQAPARRVRIYDKDLKLLHEKKDSQPTEIGAGQDLKSQPNKIAADGKYLVLDVGNPYELMWR